MLANFFGKSKPVNFVIILVLFLGYYFFNLVINSETQFSFDSVLDLLIILPGFFLFFFLFNFIISKNKLTKDNTFAFLLFVIAIGFLNIIALDYRLIGEYFLLLLFLRKVYSIRTQKSIYQKLFDGGFWIGVLFLISPYYILFLLLFFVAIALFLKITPRIVIIPFLGLITPLILFFTYYFYTDSIDVFYRLFSINLNIDVSFYNTDFYIVFLSVFGFLALVSTLILSGRIFSINNTFKRCWALLIAHLFITLVYICFLESKNGMELVVVFIPVSIIIANWLQVIKKKIIVTAFLILLLALSFGIHFIA